MGETPKITDPLAALEAAREGFEQGEDFTVGVEEEFAILDSDTLDMVSGFERFDEATRSGPLAGSVAGELIRSEVEIRTGRCETFAEAAEVMARRRVELVELAGQLGVRLSAAGAHPFARWQDQEVIDTPHYHLVESTLRYVAWRNNTFGIHAHTGIRGADRAIAVNSAMRTVLPELLALSASSPWIEDRYTHLHSTRTQVFTRMFPRCGIPDHLADWAEYEQYVRFLIATGSIREHTEIWWSVRPHQAFPTVETRICDAQPEFGQAVGLAGLIVALTARFARLYDDGAAAARIRTARVGGKPVACDPVGDGRRADRSGRRTLDPGAGADRCAARRCHRGGRRAWDHAVSRPARAALTSPALLRRARCRRDHARVVAGRRRTHPRVGWRVARAVRAGGELSTQEPPQGGEIPAAADVILSTVHLLLSVGFARTGLTGDETVDVDLVQTEQSIEAVRALMPVLERLLPPQALMEYRQALADLQLAYSRGLESPAAGQEPPAPQPENVVEPERPKIWTPRGDV